MDLETLLSDPDAGPVFVVQEHAASSHHFDVRLEVDGVLASWAVPKGPSTDPAEKRLAVRVEDHPRDYADFEGVIPEDEYGGGRVIVWDAGRLENLTTDDGGDEVALAEALDAGHATVRLHGEKLQGAWSFLHARMGGQDENWLMVKVDDDGADARRRPTSTQPESVLTGRTEDEVDDEDSDGGDGDR